MLYSCYEREYAEDNDISLDEAYSELHCDCEDVEYDIDENGEMTFATIHDYIKWTKLNEEKKCKKK